MTSNSAVSGGGTADAVTAELAALLDRLTLLADGPSTSLDPARVDQITLLERVKAAAAAAQHTVLVAFARSQVDTHTAQIASGRLRPDALGRGIGDQIGLACRLSPTAGSHRLGVARALHAELPTCRGLLAAGRIGEHLAETVVSQTRHLDPEPRRLVDKQLAAQGIENLNPRQAEALAKTLAYQADPAAYVARGRTARKDRGVSVRPAPDTMTFLTGYLPVEQGVAAWAALRRRADELRAAGDPRTRPQLMADLMVERLTGQTAATDVPVEVGIVMPIDQLLDPQHAGSAQIVGHGPVPGPIAADILATSRGRKWWRRLFTRPAGGPLVGGDPRRRCFDGFLAHLIRVRDGDRCRDPYCGAPARHLDHVVPYRAGGPTTLGNGRGACARGNYVRELPGWHVHLDHDGLADTPHTITVTTPTGHSYPSRAGPPC